MCSCVCIHMCICETAAQEHFLINTTTLCKAGFFGIHLWSRKQMSEKQQNLQLLKKEKKTPGCPLCFLSAGIQWRVSVSIYIQMSPSIFPGAGEGFTLSTVMRLTNFSSSTGRQACVALWESERKLNAFCLWCLRCLLSLWHATGTL